MSDLVPWNEITVSCGMVLNQPKSINKYYDVLLSDGTIEKAYFFYDGKPFYKTGWLTNTRLDGRFIKAWRHIVI